MSTRMFGVSARTTLALIIVAVCTAVSFIASLDTARAAVVPITNSSFESGAVNTPTGWVASFFGSTTAQFSTETDGLPGHSGRAGKIVMTNYTAGSGANWSFTPVAVTSGQSYTFTSAYISSANSQIDVQYKVPNVNTCGGVADSAGVGFAFCYVVISATPLASTSAWTTFSNTISPPAGATEMTVIHNIIGNGTLSVDDYTLTSIEPGTGPEFSQGLVSLTFDDGWLSVYTNAVAGVLDPKGMKSTQYINSQPILDGFTGFMTAANVAAMAGNGHDVGGHSRTHAHLVGLSTTTLAQEVAQNKTELQAMGATPLDNFAYPYGEFDATVKAKVAENYAGARSTIDGYNNKNSDKYALQIQELTRTTTLPQVQTWINTSLADKTWLILMFHQVEDPTCPATAEFDLCVTKQMMSDIADYLGTKPSGTVITVSQGLAAMASTTPPPPPPADTTAPVITVPSSPMSVTATSSSSTSATATFSASATDANPTNPVVTCAPASGSSFSLGTTTVTCTAADAANNHATSTFMVVVTAPAPAAPVNNAPTATAQSVSLNENTSLVITLSGTDPDAGATLVFATSSNPAHGTLTGSGATLTYSPASDYVGSDLFTFIVGDGLATSSAATISITVNDVPPPPPAPAPSSGSGSSGGGGGGGGGGFVLGSGPLSLGFVNPGTGGVVLGAATQTLTEAQITAILNLLRSFGADQSVIDSVNKALRGQASPGTAVSAFARTLTLGSRGTDVTALQNRLTKEGVYTGPTTGVFGPLTRAAVIAFQKKHGLDAVGIVGPKTRAILNGQ